MEAPIIPLQLPVLLMQYAASSDNGFAVLDADNRFVYYNASFADMFQFEDDRSMLGTSHQDLMRWMYTQHRGAHIEWPSLDEWLAYVSSKHRSAPFRSFEVDLESGRWILMTEQICEGGELVMFCSDITRQKQTEQALRVANEQIEHLAMTDELTGVPNRRHFIQQLNQELAKARRHQRTVCLAMLDLDHFKKVNDQHGHPAGDEVLKHFAYFVKRHLRLEDVLGRLGGEEFAVLMPDTPADKAQMVLSRIVDLLRAERLPQVAPDFGYSFSGGVAESGLGEQAVPSCSALLALADKALYQAKEAGRARIVALA